MSKTAFHNQVTQYERLHEKRALEFSKEVLEKYETAYSLCDEILYDLEESVTFTDDLDRQAIFMILIKLMGTMQSIKWLFLKGYYYDAEVLGRSFVESLGTCCYIHQNKGIGDKWFKDEKLCTSLEKFQAINKTLKREITEQDTAHFYRNLCKFVHGNRTAIGTLIFEVEDEYDSKDELKTIRFRYPSKYDKRIVDSLIGHPLGTLLVIQEIFPEISDFDKKEITEIQKSLVVLANLDNFHSASP
jgi:hypothetical protein